MVPESNNKSTYRGANMYQGSELLFEVQRSSLLHAFGKPNLRVIPVDDS